MIVCGHASVMVAHSTHQACNESGKTTRMTAGVMPHCETANLPARRFGWAPESAHPLQDGPFYPNFNRQLRGAIATKQSSFSRKRPWIASLRSQ
jgi:hypothetical protein